MGVGQQDSKVIDNLRNELNKDNYQVLQDFWNRLQIEGTPLIEDIDGDEENSLVTFIYRGNTETKNVIALLLFKSKNPIDNMMEKLLNTDLWYRTYKIRKDIRFTYSFSVNDSFDDNNRRRMKNSKYDIFSKNKLIFDDDDIASYVVMPGAEEHIWIKEQLGVPKGNLYKHIIYSNKLRKHYHVMVYTPYGYFREGSPYTFLLLNDGSMYIDVLSAVTVLDNLINAKKIPPVVSVFVEPSRNRENEYKCNDNFVEFITNEIVSWVRDNYNITGNPDEAVIGGLSLGGLEASYIGFKHPEVFGNVLSQSGSYWYKPKDAHTDGYLSALFESSEKLPLKFYLNVGLLESRKMMIDTNEKFRDVLRSKGYTVYFEEFKSGHDSLCWGETLANGLIWLIGKNYKGKN